jgi:hypothetical protein
MDDIMGKRLKVIQLNSEQNLNVFDLKNYIDAFYIFTLNANNQRLQSKKISKGGY